MGILEKLAAEFPNVRGYRHLLALSQFNLAPLLEQMERRQEAEAAYRQALDIQNKLVADFPHYARNTATNWRLNQINLGVLLVGQGKSPEAEAVYRQALAIIEKVVADFPNGPEYRRVLARSHNNLGALLASQRKALEAEAAYRQAVAILVKLVASFPTVPAYRHELALGHNNLGNFAEAGLQGRCRGGESVLSSGSGNPEEARR